MGDQITRTTLRLMVEVEGTSLPTHQELAESFAAMLPKEAWAPAPGEDNSIYYDDPWKVVSIQRPIAIVMQEDHEATALRNEIHNLEARLKTATESNNRMFDTIARMGKEKAEFSTGIKQLLGTFNIEMGWGDDSQLSDLEAEVDDALTTLRSVSETLDAIRTER